MILGSPSNQLNEIYMYALFDRSENSLYGLAYVCFNVTSKICNTSSYLLDDGMNFYIFFPFVPKFN